MKSLPEKPEPTPESTLTRIGGVLAYTGHAEGDLGEAVARQRAERAEEIACWTRGRAGLMTR